MATRFFGSTRRASLLTVACVACLLGSAGSARAQHNDTPQYVEEASKELRSLMTAATQKGYKLDKGMTIAGGWIDKSESQWTKLLRINLVGGKSYRFISAGDLDAKDVDLRITDQNGKVLAEDVGTERAAVVDFTAPVGAEYMIEIRLYDSAQNVPCVCLMVVFNK